MKTVALIEDDADLFALLKYFVGLAIPAGAGMVAAKSSSSMEVSVLIGQAGSRLI